MKLMKDLGVGDEVLAPTQGGQFAFQPITWFLHRDQHLPAQFIQLTSNSRQLELSRKHLIPVLPCDLHLDGIDGEMVAGLLAKYSVFAEKAQVGQCLMHVDQKNQVSLEEIQEVGVVEKKGIYSPMTAAGSLVVEGVHVSCYSSSIESYLLQHSFYSHYHALASWMQTIWSILNPWALESPLVDIPVGVLAFIPSK